MRMQPLAVAVTAAGSCVMVAWLRRQRRAPRLVSREEALAMAEHHGARQACHTAIWAPVSYKLWGELPARYAILMQVRFDGLLGFPGGLVDRAQDGLLEALADAASRELHEELSANISVGEEDYVDCIYLPEQHICTHLFQKRISEAEFDSLERDALSAHDKFEVLGTVRCPCYALPPCQHGIRGQRGFGLFIQQRFAGNALQQLLRLVRKHALVEAAVFDEAVRDAGVHHLLL